jgi:shikimate dehydrogenase
VVQLGAGGAGAATALALLTMGCRRLTVVDVATDRARALAARFSARFAGRVTAATEPGDALRTANGLVQATPTGTIEHPGMPIDAAFVRPDLWVAEVVYFPLETELLRAARRVGCPTVDGGRMALYQAVEAFRLFTGLEPDVERMRDAFQTAGHAIG